MEKVKYVSAGVGERMQYIAHKYNDTTIRFILHYPGMLDENILCDAIKAVIDSVDVLHASFIARNRTSHWTIHANYRVSDYFTFVECDGDPMKPAQGISLTEIRDKDKCKLHVTLVQGSQSSAVVVRISHLADL